MLVYRLLGPSAQERQVSQGPCQTLTGDTESSWSLRDPQNMYRGPRKVKTGQAGHRALKGDGALK